MIIDEKNNLKIYTDNIENEALNQIYNLVKTPAFNGCKIRIMPDVHAGKGCVIGFTADLGKKVVPNLVGVDISCGMYCVNLGQVDIDFKELDEVVHKYVPSGRNINEFEYDFDLSNLKCLSYIKSKQGYIRQSIGTLGGGNHFVEIDESKNGDKILIIHTGSRYLGKMVAEYYQSIAEDHCQNHSDELVAERKALIEKLKKENREKELESELKKLDEKFKAIKPKVAKELSYLENEDRDNYLNDMFICEDYAKMNREKIAEQIIKHMHFNVIEAFHTIHNYIDHDNIIRKGAISAKSGEKVIIPLNMKDGCLICIGKGNDEWNNSASHGAGRRLSRSAAKEQLNIEEFEQKMNGIYTTCVGHSTIDESPMAYKDSNEIIENIGETVEIIDHTKVLYNFKATE